MKKDNIKKFLHNYITISRRIYHELETPTAVFHFEKSLQSPSYLMATAHHSNQSVIDVDLSAPI